MWDKIVEYIRKNPHILIGGLAAFLTLQYFLKKGPVQVAQQTTDPSTATVFTPQPIELINPTPMITPQAPASKQVVTLRQDNGLGNPYAYYSPQDYYTERAYRPQAGSQLPLAGAGFINPVARQSYMTNYSNMLYPVTYNGVTAFVDSFDVVNIS